MRGGYNFEMVLPLAILDGEFLDAHILEVEFVSGSVNKLKKDIDQLRHECVFI